MHMRSIHLQIIALMILLSALCTSSFLIAQSNLSNGTIQGTVTDPSGAVVPGAKVTITNNGTGQTQTLSTNGSGLYSAGSLQPGSYTVEVTKQGFSIQKVTLPVQVGVSTAGNVQLALGNETQVVEVNGGQIAVDTTQPVVQGVLTPEQIQNLPVNGRNFLDLAQLEPGVQLEDGQSFDPTKAGYSSVSFNGVNGRTARIELDGVDVSDETVGTTVLNISSGSIEEFQVARSSLDPATELTSSGSINVSTKSGTNHYHGEAFGLFRDRRAGFANSPGGLSNPFQRNQFGGSLGGAIIKDKLFFFANSERVKQDQLQPLTFSDPFSSLNGGFTSPYRDTYSVGKLDWNATKAVHVFYRFSFEQNLSTANFGNGYSVFSNRDNTPAHAVGVDFNAGSFTHSFRFQYLKFHNLIGDGTHSLSGAQNPIPSANLDVTDIGLQTGPNLLAPQQTYQANHQVKYDGSKSLGNHIIRYGASFNRINGGGFASFFGLAPQIQTSFANASAAGVTDLTNLLNYPINNVILGNGQGFFTEIPAFGAPAGGQRDNRLSLYIADAWKMTPRFTFSFALRYQRDTGRNDSDLAPIPCSQINASIVSTGLAPCSGSTPLFDSFLPGLGKRVRQPDTNFGPQAGFAWDVTGSGKTVIRAGAGIFYENSIFNNTLFDRPGKLAQGLFFNTASLCGGINSIDFPTQSGTPQTLTSFNGQPISQICSGTIGQSGATLAALQQAYQAAVKAAGPASNPSFVGNTLSVFANSGLSAYSPNYQPTRSYQMNVGIQRALWHGGVFTADYIRNVGIHFPLAIDVNHVGDARFLNVPAAQNAIAATLAACGVGTINQAIAACPGLHSTGGGATINDFAANGLDSGDVFLNQTPASVSGLTPATGAAFPGVNPLMGQGLFQYYIGRSVYNGLQLNYRQAFRPEATSRFLKGGNFEASYSLSRFESNGGDDQNFSATAFDYVNPTKFFGPTNLDRTHQVSFGGVFDFKYGPRLSLISHFYSAPPSTLFVGNDGSNLGEIFRTDFTGSGIPGSTSTATPILPGTNVGNFGRGTSPGDLNKVITNYNNTQAGTVTPAGQALLSSGLFTQAQLTALGAVKPTLNLAPPGQFGNGILRTFDARLSYPFSLWGEHGIHLEPSVGFFNLFNFANFGNYNTFGLNQLTQAGQASAPGTISNTGTTADRLSLRTGNGSGTFSQGSPRELEFGLRITF